MYIAGAAKKMPLDVRASIKKIIMEHSSFYKSAEQAEKYMQFLESSNRYILDVWS